MRKTLLSLLALSSYTYVTSAGQLPKELFLSEESGEASEGGARIIELKHENGVYVGTIKLGTHTDEEKKPKAMFSLYSIEATIMGDNCLGFTSYKTIPGNSIRENTSQQGHMYLPLKAEGVSGYMGKAPITVAHSIKTNIQDTKYPGVSNVVGYIGLAPGWSSILDRKKEELSIRFVENNSKVRLGYNLHGLFDLKTNGPTATFKVNELDWKAQTNFTAEVAGASVTKEGFLTNFDMNSQYIGVPTEVFKVVKDSLASKGAICSDNIDEIPTCSYIGKVSNLPTFTLAMDKDSVKIVPQVYVKDAPSDGNIASSFQLNIVTRSVDGKKDFSYVDPYYYNRIVLGASYMKHYYITIERFDGKVKVYNDSDIFPEVDEDSEGFRVSKTLFIILLMLIAVVQWGYGAYLKCNAKKEENNNSIASGYVAAQYNGPNAQNQA